MKLSQLTIKILDLFERFHVTEDGEVVEEYCVI
jgi:hypothetical protein